MDHTCAWHKSDIYYEHLVSAVIVIQFHDAHAQMSAAPAVTGDLVQGMTLLYAWRLTLLYAWRLTLLHAWRLTLLYIGDI